MMHGLSGLVRISCGSDTKGDVAMRETVIRCTDTAGEYCPCALAETGDCLICSRLQGRDECSCDWTGICIYNDFVHNGMRCRNVRNENVCTVKDISFPAEDFAVMSIQCGRGMAGKCLEAGSYVFVRNESSRSYYDIPLSLLSADDINGNIVVGFRIISAKTKKLASAEQGEKIVVRGPYRGGIKGLGRFGSNERILVAASGAGAVPAVFAYNILKKNNRTDLMIEDGIAERFITEKYLNCDADEIGVLSQEALKSSSGSDYEEFLFSRDTFENEVSARMIMRNYDTVILLGGRCFTENMRRTATACGNIKTACSADIVYCCGEGVCGACVDYDENGKRVPSCKNGGRV